METFYRTHAYLAEHTTATVRRELMDKIDWNHRLIGIRGTRGVGKTTFLLQYAKEKFGTDRSCLYINMNNLYFSHHSLVEFAADFIAGGGKVLLIDQIFKHPNYSKELRACHDLYPELRIVFTGSSVMNPGNPEECPEICDIVSTYNLRGFSFREFLNLQTGMKFRSYTLDEIISDRSKIAKGIASKIEIEAHFKSYLHHGFYPFFLEKRNFSENLLKTMNMMLEVDILLIKQIELKYLPKIKKLLYLLANGKAKTPNVSQLATEIQTSRATVMNYIQYLQEARLLNMVYKKGESFPKKPSKIFMHNTNLLYCFYPIQVEEQEVYNTFFVNNLWGEHKVGLSGKDTTLLVDDEMHFSISNDKLKARCHKDTIQVTPTVKENDDNTIPLWLFGFLY